MMISLIAYDTCRDYVMDRAPTLTESQIKRILGYLRARDIDRLSRCGELFDAASQNVEAFRTLRQVAAFFKKHRNLSDDDRCLASARQSFEKAERVCRITNRRLSYYYTKRERLALDLSEYIKRMEYWISDTLGSYEDFLALLPRLIRLTSGASANQPRRRSLPYLKVKAKIECTPRARPYLNSLSLFYGYGERRFDLTLENRVEAVPKNWKTHRLIACEPQGNLPLQLAFDTYVKERLARKGINLFSQIRNQELARKGSISGEIATVDLSMASDTLSINTVAWLLPVAWFQYLDDVRTPRYRFGDSKGFYAKFSSMGNGATFSLETLVFAAAAYAVGSKINCVYGDDIIIESTLYPELKRLLSFLGFIVNTEKSYSSGPFRESCGKDFFDGIDVTPFYLRYEDSRKVTLSHIVNNLASLTLNGLLWKRCLSMIASHQLPLVPFNSDSTSGVWVDVTTAYALGLIKSKRSHTLHIPVYRAYVSKTSTCVVSDMRTYFLWFLDRNHWRKGPLLRPFESSRVATSEHRYVRKWVCWIPPATATPDHLYWWSELIHPLK